MTAMLARKQPMRRTGFTRKQPKSKGAFPPHVRELVALRSQGRCEVGTHLCRGAAVHIHHIRLRSQGGKGTLANALHVCMPCHAWLHNHPEESYENGWLQRSGQTP